MQIVVHTRTVLGVGSELNRKALDAAVINGKIAPYWRVSVVDVTESTQNDLKDLLSSHRAHIGDVIAAEYQSAGRGRLDRTFSAPSHSALLFSFLITPSRAKSSWGWIPLLASVAIVETLRGIDASAEVTIKWPNDILFGEKKVAGLLCETIAGEVIVGVGINVSMAEKELPVSHATSLFLEGFNNLDRDFLLIEILNNFSRRFQEWDSGSDEVAATYRKFSSTLGRQVRIESPRGTLIEGIATGISVAGELVLGDGAHVSVGDVVHLR